jgi:transposase
MQIIRTIIQLKIQTLSGRAIAKQLQLSRNTVANYLQQITATGLPLDNLRKLNDEQLANLLYAQNTVSIDEEARHKEFCNKVPYFLSELKRTGVTRQLLWNEYLAAFPDGYRYSQFCYHLQKQTKKISPSYINQHQPAEQMMVDFAGDMVHYVDKQTGELVACPVLVCVLPYSGYTYVEALPNARLPHLVTALNKCLRFFKGVPLCFKTDNMKQVIIKSNRYEPTFTELIQQWALHYNIALTATRPFKPKDKAAVENHVKIIYNRVYAPLRDKVFFSLHELNEAMAEQLDAHNYKNYQAKTYSRIESFEKDEQALLQPLPDCDFEIKHSVSAKVQKNYHITLGEDWHHYSVPFTYIGEQVTVIYSMTTVEIYCNHKRIAVHQRSVKKHGYTTTQEHMPENHKHYHERKGWDESYFLRKASSIGPSTQSYIQGVLNTRRFTEQTFNACKGILRLAKDFGAERVEAACTRALPSGVYVYKTIANILKSGLDKELHSQQTSLFQLPQHDNIRGADAYQ